MKEYIDIAKQFAAINDRYGVKESNPHRFFSILRFWERRMHKFAEMECMVPDFDYTDKREHCTKRLAELFVKKDKFLAEFFINCDPRGYSLKVKFSNEREADSSGIYLDWGKYGILAPDNLVQVTH